jgi:hypothetical protein
MTESTMALTNMVSELERIRFFGSLEIKFEAGKVVLLKKTETIKPDECPRNNRGDRSGPNT